LLKASLHGLHVHFVDPLHSIILLFRWPSLLSWFFCYYFCCFRCDLQCSSSQLGSLYGVLNKRRGSVLKDDLIDGTDLFLIR